MSDMSTAGIYYTQFKDKVEACPCCGNTDLYIGHLSSCIMGVHCWFMNDNGCGLRMGVDMFSNPAKGTTKTVTGLERAAVNEAVRRWNKRAGRDIL